MTLFTFLPLLLLLCSGVEFPVGSCAVKWEGSEVVSIPAHVEEGDTTDFTGNMCRVAPYKGTCCSHDKTGMYYADAPAFDPNNKEVRNAAMPAHCRYCWRVNFDPVKKLQSAPASVQMHCTHTKPNDMKNVKTFYSAAANGKHLQETYCTTQSATPLMTANTQPMLQNHVAHCKNPVMPNLPGKGYNILTGMPLPAGENALDPGFLNSPVFDPAYDNCITTDNQQSSGYLDWTVPDVYTTETLNSLSDGIFSKSMHDEKSFQKQAMQSLSVSGSGKAFGVDMEFTAGAQWESSTSSLSDGDTIEQRFHRQAWAYKTTASSYDVDLSEAYLKALTSAYVSNEWSLFFLSYGTHVVTEVVSGARYTQVSHFSRSKFEEISSNSASYKAGIKATYAGATGNVDVNTTNTAADRAMIENSATTQYIVSIGGNGEALNDADSESRAKYLVVAHNYPAPLSLTMLPHNDMVTMSQWEAFKKALALYKPDEPTPTTDEFQKRWLTAIQVYCKDDAHLCQSASSVDAPIPMTLSTMNFDSDKYGNADGNFNAKFTVNFGKPDFQDFKPLIKISKIHTFCSKDNKGMGRLRGIQFEYFDGDRSATTDILGTKGDSPSDAGKSWDHKENEIAFGEIITSVLVSAGSDIDGIWFQVQTPKSQTTRTIGCGYHGAPTKSWNIKSDHRLLGLSGTSANIGGQTVVKQLQFRNFLFILPTLMANGPECQCVTPNQGLANLNGAKCTNGQFLWCAENMYCTKESSFPIDQFEGQCSTNKKFLGAPEPSAHHQALLQKIVAHKKAREALENAAPHMSSPKTSFRSSNSTSNSTTTKNSTHHIPKWEEAKHSVKHAMKHAVQEMSKSQEFQLGALCLLLVLCSCLCCPRNCSAKKKERDIKPDLKTAMKTEMKEVFAKELKLLLGNIQEKQNQLEGTVTRMLLHQVENY